MPTQFPPPTSARRHGRGRELSSVGNALRKKEKLRVRSAARAPDRRVAAGAGDLAQFEGILREELNVKSVESCSRRTHRRRYGISHRLSVERRAAGPPWARRCRA
ncbi:hypothetical protein [Microbacterium sp.]|uniref:hypothetical protein n=1 Tax=Microbacterium sp. TaxID=51671 RepID=UPI003A955187